MPLSKFASVQDGTEIRDGNDGGVEYKMDGAIADSPSTNVSENAKVGTKIFVDLMRQFYKLGWCVGSSGGMAMKDSDNGMIYFSPSSVQKERLKESDLFVYDASYITLARPPNIKESACTPLFKHLLQLELVDCVIHTHSKYSNILTQLLKPQNTLEISNQEMIKGVWNRQTNSNYSNIDRLIVPIIENAPQEYELLPALNNVLREYPASSAILVRNHGLFVFGPSWQKTKIMLECYEYLCELACEMINRNLPLVNE